MKIDINYKIDLAANPKENREALRHPYLEGDQVIATDGHILAVVPIERDNNDTDGPIPSDAFKELKKATGRGLVGEIECSVSIKLVNGLIFDRPEVSQYPSWREVVPRENKEVLTTVSFNPELLLKLAKAIGSSYGIKLVIYKDDKEDKGPMRVESNDNDNEAYGVIMPMRI